MVKNVAETKQRTAKINAKNHSEEEKMLTMTKAEEAEEDMEIRTQLRVWKYAIVRTRVTESLAVQSAHRSEIAWRDKMHRSFLIASSGDGTVNGT